jgi:hypothetical protein
MVIIDVMYVMDVSSAKWQISLGAVWLVHVTVRDSSKRRLVAV